MRSRCRRQNPTVHVVALAAVVSMLLIAAQPAQAVTPVKVVGTKAYEDDGRSNGTYVGWTANTLKHPTHWDALARRVDGTFAFRLNARGTQGFMADMWQGTDKALFQQTVAGSSDLFLFDLSSRTRHRLPFANTADWEWGGRISDTWVLFIRDLNANATENLVLMKRATGGSLKLLSVSDTKKLIITGTVGERFASWTVCGQTCTAYLYNIGKKHVRTIPTVRNRAQYAPVVDEAANVVYYARSGAACGSNVSVWRLPVGLSGSPTKILALPKGIDMNWAASLAPRKGSAKLDLLFTRIDCSKGQYDVYVARGVSEI